MPSTELQHEPSPAQEMPSAAESRAKKDGTQPLSGEGIQRLLAALETRRNLGLPDKLQAARLTTTLVRDAINANPGALTPEITGIDGPIDYMVGAAASLHQNQTGHDLPGSSYHLTEATLRQRLTGEALSKALADETLGALGAVEGKISDGLSYLDKDRAAQHADEITSAAMRGLSTIAAQQGSVEIGDESARATIEFLKSQPPAPLF